MECCGIKLDEQRISNVIRRLTSVLLIACFFVLPISLTLKSIIVPIVVAGLIYSYRLQIYNIYSAPWSIIIVMLFLLVCCDSLRGIAGFAAKLGLINSYIKLLFLPLLAFGLQNARLRFWAVQAFLLAILITVAGCALKYFDIVQFKYPGDPGACFFNHIVTGYFIAFAAFLSAVYAVQSKGNYKYLYSILSLIFSLDILFINTSHTGIAVFVLLSLLFFAYYGRNYRKILYVLPLLVLLGWSSNMIHVNFNRLHQEAQDYVGSNQDTSLGYRLQFYKYSYNLFLKNPLIGLGTGGYASHFVLDKPILTWDGALQPHSEFWFIAVEHGLLGLILFLLFFVMLFYISLHIVEMRVPMQGLLLSFLAGCLFDDIWLSISATGYLLVLFTALGIGEWLQNGATESLKSWGVCSLKIRAATVRECSQQPVNSP